MEFNDLLTKQGISPTSVLILRHRPFETKFNKVFPWLAANKPDWFNAYQQTQGPQLEKVMLNASHIASFIGHEAGKALFVGLYSIGQATPLTLQQYWKIPAYVAMRDLGMQGFTEAEHRPFIRSFDLSLLTDFYSSWKGRLVVGWPPPERSWWRRAHRNVLPVISVTEESILDSKLPDWDELILTWSELKVLPLRLRLTLSQWPAVYYIFDQSDGKGYIGSACGQDNLYQRWENYGASGHGGNVLLRKRDPKNFLFSILQRLSPDMKPDDVVQVERSWKERLHTKAPFGLNEN